MKVLIASPPYANGVCWLVNCFLELGVLCYRNTVKHMWEQERCLFKKSREYSLRKIEYPLQAHLPIFAIKKKFNFIGNLYVEWDHVWPREGKFYDKVILFVRDPRDAVLSMYKRQQPHCSFDEYIMWIQYSSLMQRLDEWNCFHLAWLSQENVCVIRFEDYKSDPISTLNNALHHLGLDFSIEDMRNAIDSSTHVKAKEAEDLFYRDNPHMDTGVRVNRSSSVSNFSLVSNIEKESIEYIESVTTPVKKLLGYDIRENCPPLTLDYFIPFLKASKLFLFLPSNVFKANMECAESRQFSLGLLDKIYEFIRKAPYVHGDDAQYDSSISIEEFFSRLIQLQKNILTWN